MQTVLSPCLVQCRGEFRVELCGTGSAKFSGETLDHNQRFAVTCLPFRSKPLHVQLHKSIVQRLVVGRVFGGPSLHSFCPLRPFDRKSTIHQVGFTNAILTGNASFLMD